MKEEIANEIAKRIEHLLSKAQVIDRINNDEIVKRQDYLSLASGVLTLIREEIEKVENPYPKGKLASAEYYEGEGFHRACQAILKALEAERAGVGFTNEELADLRNAASDDTIG